MKAGIMTYGLKNGIPEQERSLENIIQLAADEGIEGVEVYSGDLADRDILAEAPIIRKHADACGVEIFGYGSGTRVGYLDERKETSLETLKKEIEVCPILGAKVLTFPVIDSQPVPPGRSPQYGGLYFEKCLPALVEQVQELGEFAAEFSVNLAVLNHCFLVYLSWHQKWIALLSGCENVGACADLGNYPWYGSEDALHACKIVAPVTKLVRLFDVTLRSDEEVMTRFRDTGEFSLYEGPLFGEGEIDHVACLTTLRAAGYDGYLSLKRAGASDKEPLEAIRQAMKNINALLKQI